MSGNESVQPDECARADQRNETGWEAGEIGCTDNDWCDPDHCSPILIDFSGDLFQLSGAAEPVHFDIDGDGSRRAIGWTRRNSDDAFLCLDRNRNGQIDSGAELFGTATRLSNGDLAANGYEAMAELDRPEHGGNADGVLSAEDAAFRKLCIWRDQNRDGVSQKVEMESLILSGVLELGLDYSDHPHLDADNNLLLFHGGAIVSRDGVPAFVRTVDVFFSAVDRPQRPGSR
ncbi:MAG: hypothetical protein AAFX50_12075 [Acidobacteriota bacterium]